MDEGIRAEDTDFYFRQGRMHLKNFPQFSPYRDLIQGKKSPYQNGITRMDVQPLMDKKDWFRIGPDYKFQIQQKKKLIESYPEVVIGRTAEGEPGARELPRVMARYLAGSFPEHFAFKDSFFENSLTGDKIDLDAMDPLHAAALMVQEDLILIHAGSDGQYCLTAGALCFPSAWSLREKLGKNIMAIHEPVPLVNQKLGKVINKFLASIETGQQFWRINFLTTSSPRLSQLKGVPSMLDYRNRLPLTRETVGDLYLRNERETFTRLPESRDILFTLRTYMTSFRDLSPFTAGQLANLLKVLPAENVNEYRELSSMDFDLVLSFLMEKSFEQPLCR